MSPTSQSALEPQSISPPLPKTDISAASTIVTTSASIEPASSLSMTKTAPTTGDVSPAETQSHQTSVAGSYTSLASHGISPVPIASPFSAASSGAVATTNQRAPSLKRPAFIGASAGLSAAAFVIIIAVVLLFRRDRRLTRGAKLVQLSQPRNANLFGYASPGRLRQSGIAGADGLPGDGARDPALGTSPKFRTYARTSEILMPARTPATTAPSSSSRCRRYTCSQGYGALTHSGDM